jgi:hypothetical protein
MNKRGDLTMPNLRSEEQTPSTSAKESNENDIHMKPEPAAFQEDRNDEAVASEKLRYENADEIYP